MDKPLISVCCMTYNHKAYIRQALNSVLGQKTEFPFEVIVHDDASTDGTADIVREYENRYPDIIRPIYQTENKWSLGFDIEREYIYPAACGKYIAILECDDYWTDDTKLQKQVSYMEKHPDCSGSFHAADWICNEKVIGNDRRFNNECDVSSKQVILGGGEYCATSSLCFRSEYALDYPKFREIANVDDYPLQILLSLRGKFHGFPQIMSAYRFVSPGSWTEKQRTDSEKRYVSLRAEACWLKELNQYTQGKYKSEIFYKIGKGQCVLYKNGQISFQELTSCLKYISKPKLKLSMMKKCYERYLRYGLFR